MTAEPMQLPIFVITGTNWTTEIQLDEFNAKFDNETQIHEAATRAIEVFKMMREDARLIMNPDSRLENPQLGTTVLVHLKGTDPENALVVITHVCLGNIGLYKEAAEMENVFNKQVEQMRKLQQEQEARQTKVEKEIKDFEKIVKKKSRKIKE
jgi:hypothetical protein